MFLIKRTTDKKYASGQCAIKQTPTKGTALDAFAANYTNPV